MSRADLVPGARCVCMEPEWWNLMGDRKVIHRGTKLIVADRQYVAGIGAMLSFEEYGEDDWFVATGFRPELDG